MNVLVIGSGGREHALLKACLASPLATRVIAAPGNGGMEADAQCFPLDVENVPAAVELAKREAVDMAIIGPEVPLALGMADALREAGVLVYGPGFKGAQLEASKAVCKDFFAKYGIPTARSRTFSSAEIDAALRYVAAEPLPVVIKASGLAAGKGVIIAQSREEALDATRGMLDGSMFGEAGAQVVVEECLVGDEASITLIVCGDKYVMLPAAQDHKRVGEGDSGPNTGGMGAYCPAPVVTPEMERRIVSEVIEPTMRGFAAEEYDFRGTLFIGIMVTAKGPMVLEFNVRFGDPETQVVLPMLDADPLALMLDCAKGTLDPANVAIRSGSAIVVVLAAKGYPGKYAKGDLIGLPTQLPVNSSIVHAGTKRAADGSILSAGGRVLGVCAQAETLQKAADIAYGIVGKVQWDNKNFRRDIGHRAGVTPAK
ncbi:MAG: phosphoribosylamine--glycine ligase [Opitutales bacterium]|nr:phosphoribosylamine--glycine ligase [Opitutales bacterium]